jgi:hypothetical protein
MFKLTNLIIPASEIREIPGKDNARLRLSVNCYERDTTKDGSTEEINMILAHGRRSECKDKNKEKMK